VNVLEAARTIHEERGHLNAWPCRLCVQAVLFGEDRGGFLWVPDRDLGLMAGDAQRALVENSSLVQRLLQR